MSCINRKHFQETDNIVQPLLPLPGLLLWKERRNVLDEEWIETVILTMHVESD